MTHDVDAGFWQIVTSVEWMATVGLPLVVTVGSVAVAWWLVRRQMAHDRGVAGAQRAADAASRLGATLMSLKEQFDNEAADSEWWQQRAWPGRTDLFEAEREARILLRDEDVFDVLKDTSACVVHGWAACHTRLDRSGVRERLDRHAVALGIYYALRDHVDRLATIGLELRRWDGFGRLVLAPAPTAQPGLPRGSRDRYDAWRDAVADRFEAYARQLSSR